MLAGALFLSLPPAVSPAWSQAAAAPAPAAESEAPLTPRDIQSALAQMEALGRFFGAFATRDTNGFAKERWRRLSLGYPGTAAILRDLMARDLLLIDDLPEGRSSGLLDHGEIVLDRDLDGRWLPTLLQGGGRERAARRLDLLIPTLFEALARRQPPQDWPWLADHLGAVGGLGALAQDPAARPLLVRFFQAKDAYLWLAMQRIAEGDPASRTAIARRQMATFNAIRGLATDMAATFGAAPATRLQDDWSEYVALVDGFAVTRGWLLLDPALRQTQLGAAARREADAVDQAAAEVMASAPRSALAAARRTAPQAPAPGRAAASERRPPAGVPLNAILAQSQGVDLSSLAAELPLQALALRPEASVSGLNAAAYRDFAARIREAANEPDPRQVIAEREQQLGAAREEVTTLQSRVGDLAAALDARAAEAEKLEAALVEERARASANEQRAAEETQAAKQRLAETESRLAEQQAAAARAAAEHEAEQRAAEQRAAAQVAEVQRRLAEQEAAATREAAERKAAEERAAEQVAEAQRRLAVQEAAVAREAAEREAEQKAAEARAAEQAAEAQRRLDEAEARLAAQQAAEARAAEERAAAEKAAAEKAAAERAAKPPPAVVAPPPVSTADDLGKVLDRIERRQLYMMGAIALIFLLALLLWLGGRRRAVPVERPPLLLTAPAAATPQAAAAASPPLRPIIEVTEDTPQAEGAEAPPAVPRVTPEGGPSVRVNGVVPPTAAVRAAMKAGSVRREAARASGEAGPEADLGSEADAVSNPIVRALRQGNLPLFELLFSELTDLRAPQLQRIVYGGRGEDLAIVCRAVGVDKLLFGSIYMLTDHLRGGEMEEEPERTAAILRMYDRMPPATAKKVLAKWQRNWSGDRQEPPADG